MSEKEIECLKNQLIQLIKKTDDYRVLKRTFGFLIGAKKKAEK